jgi:hypothetical protein
MPLNMQEKDEFPMQEGGDAPPPIRRRDTPNGPDIKTILLIVLLVAIIGAGGYLLYRYRVFGKKSAPAFAPATLANPWKPDSAAASPQTTPRSSDAGAATGSGTTPAAPAPVSQEGRLTVYISSYKDRADAEEEASRWSAAGFTSFVEDVHGWHRVAFGRYADVQAAQKEADRWKPAFENGYWIGPVN